MDREKVIRYRYLRRKMNRKKNLPGVLDAVRHGVEYYKVILDELELVNICIKLKRNRELIESIYTIKYHEMRVNNEESMVFFLEKFIEFKSGFYFFGKNLDEYPAIKIDSCFSPIKFFNNVFKSETVKYDFHVADICLKWIFCIELREDDYLCPGYKIYIDETFPYCSRDMVEYWSNVREK